MELRCNNCNEILDEFGCDYNADVTSYYSYNKEKCEFELVNQDLDNDKDTNIYCTKCGKTLSDEIINMLKF